MPRHQSSKRKPPNHLLPPPLSFLHQKPLKCSTTSSPSQPNPSFPKHHHQQQQQQQPPQCLPPAAHPRPQRAPAPAPTKASTPAPSSTTSKTSSSASGAPAARARASTRAAPSAAARTRRPKPSPRRPRRRRRRREPLAKVKRLFGPLEALAFLGFAVLFWGGFGWMIGAIVRLVRVVWWYRPSSAGSTRRMEEFREAFLGKRFG